MTKPSHILTRAERIAELDELSLHYDKTLQKENVKWAKVYRAGFPLDQVIPNENVCFQNGEVIDESDIDFEKGVMQDEGRPDEDYMTGHGQGSQKITLPGPVANNTGDTSWN